MYVVDGAFYTSLALRSELLIEFLMFHKRSHGKLLILGPLFFVCFILSGGQTLECASLFTSSNTSITFSHFSIFFVYSTFLFYLNPADRWGCVHKGRHSQLPLAVAIRTIWLGILPSSPPNVAAT